MNILLQRQERAKELKQMRKSSGLSQEKLSALSTLAQSTIRAIEGATVGWNIDSELLYVKSINEFIKSKQISDDQPNRP